MKDDPLAGLNKESSVRDVLDAVEVLFDELIESQHNRRTRYARTIISNLTEDDLLQPQDYREIDKDPRFQYEDGQLTALRAAKLNFRSRIASLFLPSAFGDD